MSEKDLHFAQFQRLEPRVRPDSHGGYLDVALEARVADPLFLLARQWQLAEFQGEDGGSPVETRLAAESVPITRFALGEDGSPGELPADRPLEFIVEHGADPGMSVRARARAGLHFLALLGATDDELVDAILAECEFPQDDDSLHESDSAGQGLRTLLAQRAPDGARLAARLKDGWEPQGLSTSQRTRFAEAADKWQAWFAAAHPEAGSSAWVSDRLEHRFSLAASFDDAELVFRAPEFGGGRIEAYHLDLDPDAPEELRAPHIDPDTSPPQSRLPTRATYPGMPSERWWELEDATVNLPAIDAGPADLARLLLVEFANVYGNDWWVIPVDLDVGSVHRIASLKVVDTFGEDFEVEPTDLVHEDGWSAFRHTDRTTGRPGLPVLPLLPTAPTLTEADPVEEVLFLRDEMANLAWAVERVVEGADGRPRRRSDEVPDQPEAPGNPIEDALVYRLMTPVPAHWIPLVPIPRPEEGPDAIQFRRGRIARFAPDGGEAPSVTAAGRILEPMKKRVTFREEEVTRAGVRVTRIPVLARWFGGTTAAWTSRRAETGRGEGSSGLAFDEALSEADLR